MKWQRAIDVIGLGAAYFTLSVVGAIWIVIMAVVYSFRGAFNELRVGIPTEWASIVRHWRKIEPWQN